LQIVRGGFFVVYRLRERTRQASPVEKEEISRILLINTTAIGDTVMSTPAIRAIRMAFPKASIASLVSRRAKPVLEANPYLDELIEYPGKFKKPFHLIRELRRRAFDLVVVLHGNDPDIAPLSYLTGARYRIGWAESQLAFLFTHTVARPFPPPPFIVQRLALAALAGAESNDPRMEWFITPEEEAWANEFLERQGIGPKDLLVGFSPGGSRPSRWWRPDSFAVVGDVLAEAHGARVLIFGDRRERELAQAIAQQMSRGPLVVAGQISLRKAAALLKRCRLLISTDNGLLHIARALEVPVVALFGPEDPGWTGPWSEGPRAQVIRSPHPCLCPRRVKVCPRGTSSCMAGIRVEEVLQALGKLPLLGFGTPSPPGGRGKVSLSPGGPRGCR